MKIMVTDTGSFANYVDTSHATDIINHEVILILMLLLLLLLL